MGGVIIDPETGQRTNDVEDSTIHLQEFKKLLVRLITVKQR